MDKTKPLHVNTASNSAFEDEEIDSQNARTVLSDKDKSDLVKVIEALAQFGGSVSFQAEPTKVGRMFQSEENPLMRENVEWWSKLKIVNMGILKIKHAAIVLLLAW